MTTTTTALAALPEPAPTAKQPGRARSIIASVVLVVAFLLTPFTTLSYAAHNTLVDQEAYLATVGPIMRDPGVQQVVAETATDALLANVDLNAIIENTLAGLLGDNANGMLGGAASMISGPLASGLRNLVQEAVLAAVASDQFASAWDATNAAAQTSLLALLEGKNEGILRTDGDTLVLNVTDVINGVRVQLAARDGFAFLQNVPAVTGERLVTVATVPGLSTAQEIFKYANPFFGVLPWILAALYAAAILIARRRPRMTIIVGATLIVGAFVTNIIGHQAWDRISTGLDGTIFEPAANAFWAAYAQATLNGLPRLYLLGGLVVVGGVVWMVFAKRRANAQPVVMVDAPTV